MTEEQKINELLKPRYIVENLYPGCAFNPGDILVKIPCSNAFSLTAFESGMYAIPEDDLKKYPYLFRELRWDEERTIEQMPEYLKYGEQFFKVKEWHKELRYATCEGREQHPVVITQYIKPATSAEYTTYISSPELK